MSFCAGERAKKVIRIWIAGAGILLCAVIGMLAGLFTAWLLIAAAAAGGATIFLVWWYPIQYAAVFHGHFDGTAVRAVKGVIWRKHVFVPTSSLRTFECWETPLQRRLGCCTLILRFAGGATILPLLSRDQAADLTRKLEEAED